MKHLCITVRLCMDCDKAEGMNYKEVKKATLYSFKCLEMPIMKLNKTHFDAVLSLPGEWLELFTILFF